MHARGPTDQARRRRPPGARTGWALAVLALLAGLALPTAAGATTATITARLSASAIRVGSTVTVSGKVSPPDATPFVIVQRFVDGRWSDRDRSGPLAADGSYAVVLRPSQVATYTLRVRSAGGGIVSPTLTLQVVPVPTITAALSHAEVAISSPVVISGAVRPIGATPRVVAQRLIDGRWVDRDAAPVDPTTGRYRITIHPTQIADYRLRVRSDQGSVHSGTLALSTFYVAYDMVDTGDALPGERVVAFTFDDGPNPTYTPRVLDVLAKYGVKATFSVVGEWAARYPDLVRREVREGHRIANHTYTHPSLPSLSNAAIRAELGATQDLILKAGGAPRCVRPPGGATNLRVEQVITEFRASATLLWNVDPSNYKRPGTSVIVSRVMGALRPGAIIGIHDGGGDRSQTVAALDQLIPLIRDAGYQIRPVC